MTSDKPVLPSRYKSNSKNPDPLGLTNNSEDEESHSNAEVLKSFLDALIITIVVIAGADALAIYITNTYMDYHDANLTPQEAHDKKFPNHFSFQYILSDKFRNGPQGRIDYNVSVDMSSKSFSAHVPISTYSEIRYLKRELPKDWAIPDTLYVVFVGSHSNPPQYTGVAAGYTFGYITADKSFDDDNSVGYRGISEIQYEMEGQYPVYISSVRPTIDYYNETLYSNLPKVNIASEEATNAQRESEDAAKNQRIDLGFTLAILAASFAAVRPPIRELIDEYSKRPSKPLRRLSWSRLWHKFHLQR